MRTKRDYYEILGLPHTATAAEIKKRYRELARKYHPDVNQDKSLGHRAFAQINEAYKTLSDPEARRTYDAARTAFAQPTYRPSAGPSQSRSTGSAGGRPTIPPDDRRPDPGRLVREAELAFIGGRLGVAANICRQAIRWDRGNARAHAILGDIYRIQGKKEQAIAEYTYAVQFNPADRDSQGKLERLLGKPVRRPTPTPNRQQATRRPISDVRTPRSDNAANIVGWGLAFFTLFLINIYPGSPIPGLKLFLASISTWSWNVVTLISLDAALVGFLLAVNNVVDHPDEELLFQHVPGTMIPLGFPLLIFSCVFFYLTAGVVLLINILQGSVSKSLVSMFAAATAVTLLAALMYEPGRAQVAMFGGNVAFPAAVIGWYIGSLFAPLEK